MTKIMRAVFILALSLAWPLTSHAQSERWTFLCFDGQANKYFYDNQSVAFVKGQKVELWLRIFPAYKRPVYKEGDLDFDSVGDRPADEYPNTKDFKERCWRVNQDRSIQLFDSGAWTLKQPIPPESIGEVIWTKWFRKS